MLVVVEAPSHSFICGLVLVVVVVCSLCLQFSRCVVCCYRNCASPKPVPYDSIVDTLQTGDLVLFSCEHEW
jgi:hypothetical protein